MPSAASTSAAPDFEVKARLPCLATGTPAAGDDERRARRDVVGAVMVAAGADDVDGAGRRLDLVHLGAQGAGAAGQLLGGLAAHLQAHQEGAHLGRRRVARGHDVERPLGLVDAQRTAVADLGQELPEIVDVAAHTVLVALAGKLYHRNKCAPGTRFGFLRRCPPGREFFP